MTFEAERTWARLVHIVELNHLGKENAPKRTELYTDLISPDQYLSQGTLRSYIGSVALAFKKHNVLTNQNYRDMNTPHRPVLGAGRTIIGRRINEIRMSEYETDMQRTSFWGVGRTVSTGSGSVATGPGKHSWSPISDGSYTADASRTASSGYTVEGLGITYEGSPIRWGNGGEVLHDYTINEAGLSKEFSKKARGYLIGMPESPSQRIILRAEAFGASLLGSIVPLDQLVKTI